MRVHAARTQMRMGTRRCMSDIPTALEQVVHLSSQAIAQPPTDFELNFHQFNENQQFNT